MRFKKFDKQMTFGDLDIMESRSFKNKRLETLKEIEALIDWTRVEAILNKNYPMYQDGPGNPPYPPLLLFKCLLLQKWFNIKADTELETQINDSNAFRSFLDLPWSSASPDHSTFSRFRGRLTKHDFDRITSDILTQFSEHGIKINEGIAVDARLVKSASRPVSGEKLKEIREDRSEKGGFIDKNGNVCKFSRDVESDWTVKNDKPHYGLKEHTSVDVNHGFVLCTVMSPASVHDTNYFQYCTIFSRHTKQKLERAYADKGYHGEVNRSFLSLNNIQDGIMRKDTTTARLTEYEKERNKGISKFRYIVEQYFGISELHYGAERARFTTIAKNNLDAWFRQVAFNIQKGVKVVGKMAAEPAL